MAKQVELIRKLKLKKGSEYILFIPISSGLKYEDFKKFKGIENTAVRFVFLVETTRGIKVQEIVK